MPKAGTSELGAGSARWSGVMGHKATGRCTESSTRPEEELHCAVSEHWLEQAARVSENGRGPVPCPLG